jgi:hypothetical protein
MADPCDEAGLSLVVLNCDARESLQGFTHVEVRQPADVVGGDGVDDFVRLASHVHGPLILQADAGDHDLFDRSLVAHLGSLRVRNAQSEQYRPLERSSESCAQHSYRPC